jgi:hypothetical protein
MENGEYIVTADGEIVHEGDRVYNYYDGFWVTIVQGSTMADGWFDTLKEDGTRGPLLNGERISKNKPDWMK